jgi:hypothetical protein
LICADGYLEVILFTDLKLLVPMKNILILFASICLISCTELNFTEIPLLNKTNPIVAPIDTFLVEGEFVPNQVLVKFRVPVTVEKRDSIFKALSATVNEFIHTKAMKQYGDSTGLYVLDIPLKMNEALEMGKDFKELAYVEPNFIVQPVSTSNDPYFKNNLLWNLGEDFGTNASLVWSKGYVGSKKIFVGVLDAGVMIQHEDLVDNIWVNAKDPLNKLDDDRNGFIDDANGWDFDGGNNSVFDGLLDEHGTQVAGVIGALGGNAKGIVGMNWNISMIPVKFIGSQGGTISNAIKAISYLIQLKTDQQLNLVAINASWGTSAYSHSLFQAVGLAEKADVLFVAAAGNNATSLELSPYYPASYPNANIISVGASTATGTLASFSSYGVTSVDLVAPGVGIYTTVPSKVLASAYAEFNGTSLAAAHVTGAVALYASIQKKMPTAKLVKAALLDSIVIQTNLKAKVGRAGRLNTANF